MVVRGRSRESAMRRERTPWLCCARISLAGCAADLRRLVFLIMKPRRARQLKLRNRAKEPSAGPGRLRDSLGRHERSIKEAFTVDPFLLATVAVTSRLLALRISQADSYCKMKCAAIALALQGATGLVAPRLTVKSSALNAATLEASTIAANLSRAHPAAPGSQPAAVPMHQQPC